jgi:hypothetical protein
MAPRRSRLLLPALLLLGVPSAGAQQKVGSPPAGSVREASHTVSFDPTLPLGAPSR